MGTAKNDQNNETARQSQGKNEKPADNQANEKQNNKSKNNQESSDSHPEGTRLGHYVFGKALGKGTFGKVKLAVHSLTNEKVAIKILEKFRIKDKKDIERISREIKILKKVRHPNVIQLYEIIETEIELFLIMDYCQNGELFDYIVSHQRLHEKAAVRMYHQLISGIEYIHQSGICHRDLKPENLLLDYDKTLKIVDFGLSNMYEPNSKELLKTACGSPCYAAPEMIAGKKYYGLKSDIWSSGVVLYAMVCGFLPFEDPKTSNLYKKILAGDFKIPKFLSQDCANFLQKILTTDPEKRFGVEEIRGHIWFLQQKEKRQQGLFPGKEPMPVDDKIYQKMLDQYNYDPDYSAKCIEANRHNQITATYHLLAKKQQRQERNIVERGEENAINIIGSLERGQKPTRLQMDEKLAKNINNNKLNMTTQGFNHKRGQTTFINTKADIPIGSIQAQAEIVNIQNVKQIESLQRDSQGEAEISAQKKFKLELQAEISKLRSKYQDQNEIQDARQNHQNNQTVQKTTGAQNPNKESGNTGSQSNLQQFAITSQITDQSGAGKKVNTSQGQRVQPQTAINQQWKSNVQPQIETQKNMQTQQMNQSLLGQIVPQWKTSSIVQGLTYNEMHQNQMNYSQNPSAQTRMATVSLTSPIKINTIHNRPQLQTIQNVSRQGTTTSQPSNSRNNNVNSIMEINTNLFQANSANQSQARKMSMPQQMYENSSIQYDQSKQNQSKIAAMRMNNPLIGGPIAGSSNNHRRHQSQLSQQQNEPHNIMNMTVQSRAFNVFHGSQQQQYAKNNNLQATTNSLIAEQQKDLQNKMNMTISHGGGFNRVNQNIQSQFGKNQMMANRGTSLIDKLNISNNYQEVALNNRINLNMTQNSAFNSNIQYKSQLQKNINKQNDNKLIIKPKFESKNENSPTNQKQIQAPFGINSMISNNGTAGAEVRPLKLLQGPQNFGQTQFGNKTASIAWRGDQINVMQMQNAQIMHQKGAQNQYYQPQHSMQQQQQRQGNNSRFVGNFVGNHVTNHLQVFGNNQQNQLYQYDTINYPQIVKTNNLMKESYI